MITAKIYEDKNNDMVAVILEDGQYSNYIPCPEMAAVSYTHLDVYKRQIQARQKGC